MPEITEFSPPESLQEQSAASRQLGAPDAKQCVEFPGCPEIDKTHMSTAPDTIFTGPTDFDAPTLVAGAIGFPTASRHSKFNRRYLRFFDLSLVWFSAWIAHVTFSLYWKLTRGQAAQLQFDPAPWGLLMLFSVLVILFADKQGLYLRIGERRFREEFKGLGECIVAACVLLSGAIYLGTLHLGSPWVPGFTIVISWLALASWRGFLRVQAIPGLTAKRNVLIVGGGRTAQALQAHLDVNPEFGYVVKGFIDRRSAGRPDAKEHPQRDSMYLGGVPDIPQIIREHFIDEIFICVPSDRNLMMEIAHMSLDSRVQLRLVPDLYFGVAMGATIEYAGNFLTVMLQEAAIPAFGLLFKRVVDILASCVLLVLLFPALLVIAAVVKLDSEGRAIYASFRVGRKGSTFLCYKFRTMVPNADAAKASLRHLNERQGVTFKMDDDPRVTRVGRFLRKYSLDELPQLWNVFLGQLSLVGPRPHPLDDYSRYALEHRRRLVVKPGITGLWQVRARRDPSFEKNLALDIEYIQHWSPWLDCQILWKTIGVVLSGTGQ